MENKENCFAVDYKTIGAKLSSGENMSLEERGFVYSLCLEYSENLIASKAEALRNYDQKEPSVKNYLKFVVLGRIFRLHEEAIAKNLADADSVIDFKALKENICTKLSIDPNTLSDKHISNFLGREIHERIEGGHATEISSMDMKFVSDAGAVVVAPNASKMSDGIKIILD